MSDLEIKNIFSRFQNLNLRVLIDDLRNGSFTRKTWVTRTSSGSYLCPIAHGNYGPHLQCQNWSEYSKIIGVCFKTITDFTFWWDHHAPIIEAENILLSNLESIWRERLEDADAVQEVINQKEEALVCQ